MKQVITQRKKHVVSVWEARMVNLYSNRPYLYIQLFIISSYYLDIEKNGRRVVFWCSSFTSVRAICLLVVNNCCYILKGFKIAFNLSDAWDLWLGLTWTNPNVLRDGEVFDFGGGGFITGNMNGQCVYLMVSQ